jgi:hypothetical protein
MKLTGLWHLSSFSCIINISITILYNKGILCNSSRLRVYFYRTIGTGMATDIILGLELGALAVAQLFVWT